MKSIKLLAPAKINLHLEILGLREDCYHELAMVMQSIDLFDKITLVNNDLGNIKMQTDNPLLSSNDDNLVIKAANLIRDYVNNSKLGVDIMLEKNIPIGAGLAGGSTDAAATLFGLNTLWNLNFSIKELEILSSKLGSDVPFCITGGTKLCFGRGEKLETLSAKPSLALILVKDPLTTVSTPWAYSINKDLNESKYLTSEIEFEKKREQLRNSEWIQQINSFNPPPLYNDLEKVIEPITPSIKRSLELLNSISDSLSIAMSGSGPSCFAIFKDINTAKDAYLRNYSILQNSGLDIWCCQFTNKGAHLV